MKYKIIEKTLKESLKINGLFEIYKYFKQFVKDNLKDKIEYMMVTEFHKDKFLMFIFNIKKEITLIYYSYDYKFESPLFDLNSLPKISSLINKLKKEDYIPINKKLYKDNEEIMINLYKIN